MNRFRTLSAGLLALVLGASGLPASAQMAVQVIGKGLARDCYEAIRDKRASELRALELCTDALERDQLTPGHRAATLINRGVLHMRKGDQAKAMRDYRAGSAISPRMPEAKINLGAAFYHLGRYADALEALNDGVTAKGVQARTAAYYNRGLANEQLGNLAAAYQDYSTALQTDPEFTDAARQLARFTRVPAAN